MSDVLLDITELDAEGREFSFADQSIWTGPWQRMSIDLAEDVPLEGSFSVMPAENGWFIRGRLTGRVTAPCSRCQKPAPITLDQNFELFEKRPGQEEDEEEDLCLITQSGANFMLDAGSLLWEQFVLALPVKPLCAEDCAGLCPVCGADLNEGPCECEPDRGDSRMAVFRGLKIKGSGGSDPDKS